MLLFNDLDQELAIFVAHVCYQAGILILKFQRLDQKMIVGNKRSKMEGLEENKQVFFVICKWTFPHVQSWGFQRLVDCFYFVFYFYFFVFYVYSLCFVNEPFHMYEAVAFQGWWLACRNTSEQSNQASDLSLNFFRMPRCIFECQLWILMKYIDLIFWEYPGQICRCIGRLRRWCRNQTFEH